MPDNDNENRVRAENIVRDSVRRHPDGSALPTPLDPEITMTVVQRYIETERHRNRRVLLWLSSTFLFAILAVLVIFLSIGVIVLRRSRHATESVNSLADETESLRADAVVQEDTISVMSNSLARLAGASSDVTKRQGTDRRMMQNNLVGFRNWVVKSVSGDAATITELRGRVQELEERLQAEVNLQRRPEAGSFGAAGGYHGLPRIPVPNSDVPVAKDPVVAASDPVVISEPTENPHAVSGVSSNPVVAEPPPVPVRFGPRGEITAVTFPNGDKYEGEFRDGLFHGWGVYYYKTGDRYEGEFKNDMKHGKGAYTFQNGDKYMGEFGEDMRSGRGTMLFANGDRYVGEFTGNTLTGKGTMSYRDGNKHTGDFKGGLRHGNGTMQFANGDRYQGDFVDDFRHGQGTYTYVDGSKYIGVFDKGQRQGQGRYIYAGGDEYQGEFKQGKRHGRGVYISSNGMKIKGFWRADRLEERTP